MSSCGDVIGSSAGDVLGQDPVIVINANRTVDVQYTVDEPGAYRLEVRLFGRPIKGSPFQFEVGPELSLPSKSSPSLSAVAKEMCRPIKGFNIIGVIVFDLKCYFDLIRPTPPYRRSRTIAMN